MSATTVIMSADTVIVEKLTLPTSPTNNLNGTSRYLSGKTSPPKPVIVARVTSMSAMTKNAITYGRIKKFDSTNKVGTSPKKYATSG